MGPVRQKLFGYNAESHGYNSPFRSLVVRSRGRLR